MALRLLSGLLLSCLALSPGSAEAAVTCRPERGDILFSGSERVHQDKSGSKISITLNDGRCTGNDPKQRTEVDFAIGRSDPQGTTGNYTGPGSAFSYLGDQQFTGSEAAASTFMVNFNNNNSHGRSSWPVFVGVRVCYKGDTCSNVPWIGTWIFRAMPPSAPSAPDVVEDAGKSGAVINGWPPAANKDRETFFVDGTKGNDSNSCAQAKSRSTPKRTMCGGSGGVSCVDGAGDTVEVASGTYTESCTINATFPRGNRNGDARNPITIRAGSPGDGSTVWAVTASSPAVTLTADRIGWVIDGFELYCNGCAANAMIHLNNSTPGARFVLRRLTDHASTSQTVKTILYDSSTAGPADLILADSVFDRGYTSADILDLSNGGNASIVYNNTFDNNGVTFTSGHFIHMHGGNGYALIEGNRFRNAVTTGDGGVFCYLGCEGTIFRDNIVSSLIGSTSVGFGLERSGRVLIEGNTFYDIGRAAVFWNSDSPFVTVRNNIFHTAGTRSGGAALLFSKSRSLGEVTAGVTIEYNQFHNNARDTNAGDFDRSGTAWKDITATASDPGAHASWDTNLYGDPDMDTTTFALGPTSSAKDSADPKTPVPTGGGTRRDRGAVESGATGPPYASYACAWNRVSTRPILSWVFEDGSNWAARKWPDWWKGAADTQDRYQIQIDSSPLFNSVVDSPGDYGYPLWDSGVPAGTFITGNTRHKIDASSALTSGSSYYWRVRVSDANMPGYRSQWSDGRKRLCIDQP